MGIEIERRFLVKDDSWRHHAADGIPFSQGYCPAGHGMLRVRLAGDKAYITIKSKTSGCSRSEYEYEIPAQDAHELLQLVCLGPKICKHRHELTHNGKLWVIDVFHDDNDGLIMAEIELNSENESFAFPPWLGKEVTSDPRYCNAALAANPYCKWKDQAGATAI